MGDDFSVETLDPATMDAAEVTERYTLQRPFLSLVGRSAPVFLVNGNHELPADEAPGRTSGAVAFAYSIR